MGSPSRLSLGGWGADVGKRAPGATPKPERLIKNLRGFRRHLSRVWELCPRATWEVEPTHLRPQPRSQALANQQVICIPLGLYLHLGPNLLYGPVRSLPFPVPQPRPGVHWAGAEPVSPPQPPTHMWGLPGVPGEGKATHSTAWGSDQGWPVNENGPYSPLLTTIILTISKPTPLPTSSTPTSPPPPTPPSLPTPHHQRHHHY